MFIVSTILLVSEHRRAQTYRLQKDLPQCTTGYQTWIIHHASCFTGATLTEIGVYYITLRDPHNSSDDTSAHSIIFNFSYFNLVPRVFSYLSLSRSGGRVGEDPGNEVDAIFKF